MHRLDQPTLPPDDAERLFPLVCDSLDLDAPSVATLHGQFQLVWGSTKVGVLPAHLGQFLGLADMPVKFYECGDHPVRYFVCYSPSEKTFMEGYLLPQNVVLVRHETAADSRYKRWRLYEVVPVPVVF